MILIIFIKYEKETHTYLNCRHSRKYHHITDPQKQPVGGLWLRKYEKPNRFLLRLSYSDGIILFYDTLSFLKKRDLDF